MYNFADLIVAALGNAVNVDVAFAVARQLVVGDARSNRPVILRGSTVKQKWKRATR